MLAMAEELEKFCKDEGRGGFPYLAKFDLAVGTSAGGAATLTSSQKLTL